MATPSGPFEPAAETEQQERYDFSVLFPGTSYPAWEVDEPPPTGTDRGPSPTRVLAAAVAHCMSSTLFNCLERARVPVEPIRTSVSVEVGPNARGRRRVLRMGVRIETAPLRAEDRERFDRCVAIFEDFCTVSGAVREGIAMTAEVRPRSPAPGSSGAP